MKSEKMEKIYRIIGFYKIKKPSYFITFLLILIGGFFGFFYISENYSKIFSNEVYLEKNNQIEPKEKIVIIFSEPILSVKELNKLEVFPYQKIKIELENNKKLSIIPEDFWKLETEYSIKIPKLRSIAFTTINEKEFKFKTLEYPKVVDFSPQEGSMDVILGVEDPLLVQFNKEIKDFDVEFFVNSSNKVSLVNNEKLNTFSFLPSDIKDGEDYMTQVLIKHKDESKNKFKNIYSSSFKTAPPIESLKKDPSLMLKQAKKSTKAKIVEGKYIDLNLSAQILSIFENGKIIDSYLVSTGKRGMETPRGDFKVMAKSSRPWSKKYSLFMPFFLQFTNKGHGIHELPEWPGGYKEGASHLGVPVSHGCVRLGVGPAEQVYNWAEIGTPIIIY